MKISDEKCNFLLKHYHRLIERKFLLDIASALGRHPIHTSYPLRNMRWNFVKDGDYTPGDIVIVGGTLDTDRAVCYVDEIIEHGDESIVTCIRLDDYANVINRPLFDAVDTFELEPNPLFHNENKITTTFGRFFFNYVLWYANGVDIDYNNEVQSPSTVSKLLSKMLLAKTIDPDTGRKVINSFFYIASFTALFVPTLTEKSMQTSPEVIARKKELIAEYGERLNDPLVAKEYEQELIALDKAYLEGDVSKRFLDPLPSKTYDIHRKKMFISVGGIPAFDNNVNAYTFIPNSLSEGWTPEAFPNIINEIRKGAYDRGKKTAKGGEQTKFLLRVFQDVNITEDDCGTIYGIPMEFDEDSITAYYGQYIVTNQGPVVLTADNAGKFIGKRVIMRSPMFCKTVNGRCTKCSGEMFKILNTDALGMTMLRVGSRFTTLSMKNMHGTVIKSKKIDPFDYIVNT